MYHRNAASAHLPFPTGEMLVLNLLGSPEIGHCGQAINLVRRQARALIYRLGAQMEPVGRDELALIFWPDEADATARRNLTRLINALRASLPVPDALIATSTHVGLDPQRVWSDVRLFMELQSRSDSESWRLAATIYRGSFLAGFYLAENAEFDMWQASTAANLQMRCLDMLNKLLDLAAMCGDSSSVQRYARRYLEIDPAAESMHCRLIELYGRRGERDLARRQYEECAAALRRELDAEPMAETTAYYERSQQWQADVLSSPGGAGKAVAEPGLPMIGRENELRRLEAAHAQLRHGGVILVGGEAGSGKSRLVQQFAQAQLGLVITGRCCQELHEFAYHPLVEALRPVLHLVAPPAPGSAAPALSARLPADLETLFPELCAPPARAGAAPAGAVQRGERAHTQAHLQAHLAEALVQLLHHLAAQRGLLLCLEDLHWADESTLRWVQYLATRLQDSCIVVCATYCQQASRQLAGLKRSLLRSGLACEVEVGPLSVAAVQELLAATCGRLAEREPRATGGISLAQQVHTATGGNALLVTETISALAAHGGSYDRKGPLPLSEMGRAAILQRLAEVSAGAKAVLEVAAMIHPQIDFARLQRVTGKSERETEAAVNELVEHGILSDGTGELRFQHPIVQQVVLAALPDWRRRLLCRRATEAQHPTRRCSRRRARSQ